MDPTTGTRDDKFINLVQRDSDRYEWQAFLDKVKKLGHKEREDFIPNNAGMPSGYFKKTVAASKKVMALRETHRITSFGLEAAESISPNAIIGRVSQGMQVFLKEEKKTATILSEVRGEYGYKVKIEDGRIVNRDMHEFVVMTKDSNLQQLNENPWEVRDPKKTKDPIVKKNTLDEAMSSFLKEEKEFSIQETYVDDDSEFDAIDRLEKATIPTHICTQDFWSDKYGKDAAILINKDDEVQYDPQEGAIGIIKGSSPGMVVHLDPQEFESHFKPIGKQSVAGLGRKQFEGVEAESTECLLIGDASDEWEVIKAIESGSDLQVDADFQTRETKFGVEVIPNNAGVLEQIKTALDESPYDYKAIGGPSEEITDGDDNIDNIKEKADDNFDNYGEYNEGESKEQLDELLAFTRRGKIDMITGFGNLANVNYTKQQLDQLSDKEINQIYKQVTKDPRVTYMVSEDVQDSKNAIAKALSKKKSLETPSENLNESGIGFDAIADEIFSKFQNDPNWEVEAKKFLDGMMLQQDEITDILNMLRGEEYFDSSEFTEEGGEGSLFENEDSLQQYHQNTYKADNEYQVYFADRYIELINPDGESYFDQYPYPKEQETTQGSQSECYLADGYLEFIKDDKVLTTLSFDNMEQLDESGLEAMDEETNEDLEEIFGAGPMGGDQRNRYDRNSRDNTPNEESADLESKLDDWEAYAKTNRYELFDEDEFIEWLDNHCDTSDMSKADEQKLLKKFDSIYCNKKSDEDLE